MLDIYTMDQGTPEWLQCKLGIISTSKFSDVLAKGNGTVRNKYILKLASEIITGTRRKEYQNDDFKRGVEQEPAARAEYEFNTGNSVNQIGFAKLGRIGCSPDGLIGSPGGMEIKSAIPEIQIPIVIAKEIPPTHKPQMQGCMMVMNCEWWDFVSYSPLIKNKNFIFIKRMHRDQEYIDNLQKELLVFIKELDDIVKKMS